MALNQLEQDLYNKIQGVKDDAIVSGEITNLRNQLFDPNTETGQIRNNISNAIYGGFKGNSYDVGGGYKIGKDTWYAGNGNGYDRFTIYDPSGNQLGQEIKTGGGTRNVVDALSQGYFGFLGYNPKLGRTNISSRDLVEDYMDYFKGMNLGTPTLEAPRSGQQLTEQQKQDAIATGNAKFTEETGGFQGVNYADTVKQQYETYDPKTGILTGGLPPVGAVAGDTTEPKKSTVETVKLSGGQTVVRDMAKEQAALKEFGSIYGKMPETAEEWTKLHDLAYSGDKKNTVPDGYEVIGHPDMIKDFTDIQRVGKIGEPGSYLMGKPNPPLDVANVDLSSIFGNTSDSNANNVPNDINTQNNANTPPTPPVAGNSMASYQTPEQLKALQNQIMGLLYPTDREKTLQKQLADLYTSLEMGMNKEADEVTPMGFIEGRQASLERKGMAQINAIDRDLEIEQSKRQAALDVANTQYGFEYDRASKAEEAAEKAVNEAKEAAEAKKAEQADKIEAENKYAQSGLRYVASTSELSEINKKAASLGVSSEDLILRQKDASGNERIYFKADYYNDLVAAKNKAASGGSGNTTFSTTDKKKLEAKFGADWQTSTTRQDQLDYLYGENGDEDEKAFYDDVNSMLDDLNNGKRSWGEAFNYIKAKYNAPDDVIDKLLNKDVWYQGGAYEAKKAAQSNSSSGDLEFLGS